MAENRIDYVIVLDRKINRFPEKLQTIAAFANSLEEMGLKVQVEAGKVVKDNLYLTIRLPEAAIQELATTYNVNIENSGHTVLPQSELDLFSVKPAQTVLTQNRDIFRRLAPGRATTMERTLIIQEALNEAKFGPDENDYGIDKLLGLHVAKTAFPLHDQDAVPGNDRELLLKHWANFSMWYKEQPLNLIQKYFGSEVAFYFAWVGFYNKMLIPAALVGLLCSIGSVIHLFAAFHERVDDICTSDWMMCPLCHSGKNCVFKPLNWSCEYAKTAIVFDNHATVFFAVFMSFWATAFINLWKRRESTLKVQWNVEFEEMDTKTRTQYKEKCVHTRRSEITDKPEPYAPLSRRVLNLTLSYGTCLLLVGVVILYLFGVIMLKVLLITAIRRSGSESLERHSLVLLAVTSSFIQIVFIKVFGIFYVQISEWLTQLENPRTQSEFDSSVANKRYVLGFANNYVGLFYTAFFQGQFYSPSVKTSVTNYEIDVCHPTGCLMSVCIQLSVLMLFKSMVGNIVTLVLLKVKGRITIMQARSEGEEQWEKEYGLFASTRYLLTNEYMEMIVQYGFLTFFVAAFPLAPLCALINNCLELRLDAYKLVARYRRPVPRQHSGIGPWNNILLAITHLSVATNAFVLAFTSDFVVRTMYKYRHNTLDGYIRSRLSLYDMNDYKGPVRGARPMNKVTNSTFCYYKAGRYPPDHPRKYQLTDDYWYETGLRLICVIVFEHVVMIMNGVIAYFIPDLPQRVKESLHFERTKELELKLRAGTRDVKLRRRTRVPRVSFTAKSAEVIE